MTPDNAAAFAAELTLTAELFAAPLSDARITAYYQALEHVEWERLQPLMMAARQTERFFPTPAVYLEALAGSADVMATTALGDVWAVVAKTKRTCDMDEATHDVVDAMGGWETFQHARLRDAAILAAQFRKAYVAVVREQRIQAGHFRAEDALGTGEPAYALPAASQA
jgi:hypothetical protein